MKLILILLVASSTFAQEDGNDGAIEKSKADAILHLLPSNQFNNRREGKNLVGVFPFNQEPSTHARHGNHEEHHGHHDEHLHDEHHDNHQAVAAEGFSSREARQRNRNNNNRRNQQRPTGRPADAGHGGGAPTFDQVAAAGERCIDKIEMTEVTEYDDEVICKHSYSEQCHQSYITDYKPAQKEQCDEEFIKNCHIEYKKHATQETVRKCSQQLICGGEGPEVCRTAHTTACETKLEVHEVDDDVVNCKTEFETSCEDVTQGYSTTTECKKWPKVKCTKQTKKVQKTSPLTECRTVPTQVCGPQGCILEKGEEFCVDEVQTVINPKPVETCTLDPQQNCKHVTILVPILKPVDECVDVPKEVCSRSRTNPHVVKKPVVKKWCYTPSPESGLGK